MNMNQEILEQIDQYLEGKLSGQALEDFEKRLRTEAAFKELVEEHQLIIRSIKKKQLLEVKKKLSSFHEDMEVSNPVTVIDQDKASRETVIRPLAPRRRLGSWLAIAASVLLLIGGYFMYQQQEVGQPTDLVQDERPKEEDLVATTGNYLEIPVQNKAGEVQKEINLLLTPSLENTMKYTLQDDILVLFIKKDRHASVESKVRYDAQRPTMYFIKIGTQYYKLVETEQPTVLEQITY